MCREIGKQVHPVRELVERMRTKNANKLSSPFLFPPALNMLEVSITDTAWNTV